MGHLLVARYFARCWAFSGGLERWDSSVMKLTVRGRQTLNQWTNETISESEKYSEDPQTRRNEAKWLDGNIPTSERRVVCRQQDQQGCTGSGKSTGLACLHDRQKGSGPDHRWAGSRAAWRGVQRLDHAGPWRPWWGSSSNCLLNPVGCHGRIFKDR